mmetsp:Transcript_118977/g.167207  ORF Transcript_118977/g.167207 Transcript_118977/m.167207 type:complete len:291 (-) Transcript_118977:315-1187(-)
MIMSEQPWDVYNGAGSKTEAEYTFPELQLPSEFDFDKLDNDTSQSLSCRTSRLSVSNDDVIKRSNSLSNFHLGKRKSLYDLNEVLERNSQFSRGHSLSLDDATFELDTSFKGDPFYADDSAISGYNYASVATQPLEKVDTPPQSGFMEEPGAKEAPSTPNTVDRSTPTISNDNDKSQTSVADANLYLSNNKPKWSHEETHKLIVGMIKHGNNWVTIKDVYLPNRTYAQLKDKGRRMLTSKNWSTGKNRRAGVRPRDEAKEIAKHSLLPALAYVPTCYYCKRNEKKEKHNH